MDAANREFGDVTVSTERIANGSTFHGYFEHRFNILNRNPSRDFRVRVVLPNKNYSRSSESINRISREVTVAAQSEVTLPLLQPALPIHGHAAADIYINGRHAGDLNLAGSFQHANVHHGGIAPRLVLVSRSLAVTALDSALKRHVSGGAAAGADYSASRATGPPDVKRGSSSHNRLAWLPERSGRGSEWLELEYKPVKSPVKLQIMAYGDRRVFTRIDLLDGAGRLLKRVANTNKASRGTVRFQPINFNFGAVTQTVSKVRIEMDTYPRRTVAIDSVGLVDGKSKTHYARKAAASSTYATVSSHRHSSRSTHNHPTVLRSEWEVGQWSESWLGLTAFDVVVLHESDFRKMNGAVTEALWRFAEAGGVINVFGKAPVPKPWNDSRKRETTGVHRYMVGFGECLEFDNVTDVKQLDSGQLGALEKATRRTSAVWEGFGNAATANSAFPVVDDLSVPVKGIAFIMLLFILVVGPLNIFVLAKINRRIWMLWTIPVISLATCGVVFLYSIFNEGITPTIRVEGVTLLDHVNHRATTLGRLAYYAPLTPSGGARFNYETEVFPIVARGRSGGTTKAMDWTQGQHLQSGWVQARMPAHFAIRQSETRRERVQFERQADGRWAAINGLGAPLKSVVFRDESNETWKGGEIAAGAKVVLDKSGRASPQSVNHLRNVYQSGHWFAGTNIIGRIERDLQPGSYLSIVGSTPFMEKGIDAKSHLKADQVVVGILSPEELAK